MVKKAILFNRLINPDAFTNAAATVFQYANRS